MNFNTIGRTKRTSARCITTKEMNPKIIDMYSSKKG